jgi:hypothetical protein
VTALIVWKCAAKRRRIAKDVVVELDIKKITAPDFTVSVRPGCRRCWS